MPENPNSPPSAKTTVAVIKGGPEFLAWFNRLRDYTSLPAALLLDAAQRIGPDFVLGSSKPLARQADPGTAHGTPRSPAIDHSLGTVACSGSFPSLRSMLSPASQHRPRTPLEPLIRQGSVSHIVLARTRGAPALLSSRAS